MGEPAPQLNVHDVRSTGRHVPYLAIAHHCLNPSSDSLRESHIVQRESRQALRSARGRARGGMRDANAEEVTRCAEVFEGRAAGGNFGGKTSRLLGREVTRDGRGPVLRWARRGAIRWACGEGRGEVDPTLRTVFSLS